MPLRGDAPDAGETPACPRGPIAPRSSERPLVEGPLAGFGAVFGLRLTHHDRWRLSLLVSEHVPEGLPVLLGHRVHVRGEFGAVEDVDLAEILPRWRAALEPDRT